jgi:hypothetical protein
LKGRRFKSLSEENRFLSQWESQVADKRIHGTTRKQVMAPFRRRTCSPPKGSGLALSQLPRG